MSNLSPLMNASASPPRIHQGPSARAGVSEEAQHPTPTRRLTVRPCSHESRYDMLRHYLRNNNLHKYNRRLKDDRIFVVTLFPSLHCYKSFMFVCARTDYIRVFPVKCLSHQMFPDGSSVSALPVPERHGDVLAAAGHRVGGECGINIAVGSQCNNRNCSTGISFFFFSFFNIQKNPDSLLSHCHS